MASSYLGIDIGGTYIKLGIVGNDGRVSGRREIPIDRSGSETVMETLMRSIDIMASDEGISISGLGGIGVSAAGCIDSKAGAVAENGGNVPGWSYTKVTAPLTEKYGIPSSLANDGNCVALAESWVGAAAGCGNVLCVVLGTGVGGGIISGGRLVEGRRGYAGEIGHFPVHASAISRSGDPGAGDYENYASTSALVRAAREIRPEWESGRILFDAAGEGCKEALEVIDNWIFEIACGLTGLVHTFDPERIIIGGGVSVQQELLIEPLHEKLQRLVMPDFAAGLDIRPAVLGNSAGMVGAVKYLLDTQFVV